LLSPDDEQAARSAASAMDEMKVRTMYIKGHIGAIVTQKTSQNRQR
jgi:hypothetical protein